MTRQRRVQPVPVCGLAAIWVLLWGNLSAANVLAGVALGVLVMLVFPLPPLVVGVRVRPLKLLVLVVRFLYDVVLASFHVAWLAVRPRGAPRSSVVTVRLVGREELFHTIVGEMTTLVPGSVVIDVDSEQGLLAMHVLGAETAEQIQQAKRDVLALERRVLAALAADGVPSPEVTS